MDLAVLPVEADEALVDLLEHGAESRLPVAGPAAAALVEAAFQREAVALGDRSLCHAHLEAALAVQFELVHEIGDDEQPAAVVASEIGHDVGVELVGVEAASAVLDERDEPPTGEPQGDLHVVVGGAVADGVGAGFLDAEHDVVDQVPRGAVLAQVVTEPLAGA